MKDNDGQCRAVIGSLTQAMRARQALALAAIPCTIIKESRQRSAGCRYALSFYCPMRPNVELVLGREGIGVREWKG